MTMNKKICMMGILLLFASLLLLHNASSEKNILTSLSQNKGYNTETPLFTTRLLQVEHKALRLIEIRFIRQNQHSLIIPPIDQYITFKSHQNSYTSFHTGACVHPTECPCITSGVFCGGKPTCGVYCKFPLEKNEYQKNLL